MHLNNQIISYDVSLSKRTESIIYGSILGDGCIQLKKGYRNAILSIKQSHAQKKYLQWKVHNTNSEITGPISENRPDLGRFSQESSWLFQSHASEDLTRIHSIVIRGGVKKIRRRWLNRIKDPIGLLVWWFDDGSIVGNGRQGVLCTNSFTLEENKILQKYLKVVWSINTTVQTTKDGHRLGLSTENLKILLRTILPVIDESFLVAFKCLLLYQNSNLQQRWVSDILNLSSVNNLQRCDVDEMILNKKRNWKDYQKKI
jgi:hypothetical protein